MLWSAARNQYLLRSLTQIQHAVLRFRHRHTIYELPWRIDESIEEHVRLAGAIAEGDAATAERLASEHMRRLAELRLRMFLES